jgi:hypothetical protein
MTRFRLGLSTAKFHFVYHTITNLDSVIDISSTLHSLLSLLIKVNSLDSICIKQAKILCLALITFV